MTSSAIPISHDELLRSLTQGDYFNKQPIKPSKRSKKVNFSNKVQEIPTNETALYSHPSLKFASQVNSDFVWEDGVRKNKPHQEFLKEVKRSNYKNGKYRLDEKEREDITELLKNLQEIKTINEEELLKISINEEEDEKTLKRSKFQEEGTLTYNNIKKNTEQEQIVEVYQKPIKKNKKIKELINEDREELKRKSEDLQLQLDELDLCIAQLKGEAEIEPKKISQQTMTSYKDCYHHDNSSDVTSLQSISSRGSSFVSGKNPSPPQNPTPPRRTSSSYETCKRHSERRDSAIDSMKAEENNECQNFNSRASPQISYPPNSSETRPPQQRLPSNFLRQVQFDCDVTEERRSEANNNEGLDILKNGFNNSDTYLDSS